MKKIYFLFLHCKFCSRFFFSFSFKSNHSKLRNSPRALPKYVTYCRSFYAFCWFISFKPIILTICKYKTKKLLEIWRHFERQRVFRVKAKKILGKKISAIMAPLYSLFVTYYLIYKFFIYKNLWQSFRKHLIEMVYYPATLAALYFGFRTFKSIKISFHILSGLESIPNLFNISQIESLNVNETSIFFHFN